MLTKPTVKKLSNGIKCFVYTKKGYKEKEAMLAFGYGSADVRYKLDGREICQPSGTAHFIEHKMFEDTQTDLYGEFSKQGASANAFTNLDTTAYYFTCTENFDKNLSLLFKMTGSLCVTHESIEKEKSIISQEINMYADDTDWQSYFGMLKGMYSKNAVRDDIAGSIESISKINKDMLLESYNAFYTGDNGVLIAVGDINPQEIFERAERELKLPTLCKAQRLYYNDQIKQTYIQKCMDTATPVFSMGIRLNNTISHGGEEGDVSAQKGMAAANSTDFAKNICTSNVILEILAGKSSTFFEKSYNEGLLDYAPGISCIRGGGAAACVINGRSDNPERLREYIAEEIEHYRAYGASREYVNKITQKLRFAMERSFDSISSICGTEADCFVKNTEMLDIYEKYGKINIDDVDKCFSQINTDNIVLSVCRS